MLLNLFLRSGISGSSANEHANAGADGIHDGKPGAGADDATLSCGKVPCAWYKPVRELPIGMGARHVRGISVCAMSSELVSGKFRLAELQRMSVGMGANFVGAVSV